MSPKLKKSVPQFKLQVYRHGLGTEKPVLKIDWIDPINGNLVQKTSLLLQDGEILFEYIKDMIQYNIRAYSILLEFSRKYIQSKYLSVHHIISNQQQQLTS